MVNWTKKICINRERGRSSWLMPILSEADCAWRWLWFWALELLKSPLMAKMQTEIMFRKPICGCHLGDLCVVPTSRYLLIWSWLFKWDRERSLACYWMISAFTIINLCLKSRFSLWDDENRFHRESKKGVADQQGIPVQGYNRFLNYFIKMSLMYNRILH